MIFNQAAIPLLLLGWLSCGTWALSSSFNPNSSKPIPITVLSGFLGAGKTTLLQNMLENKQGLKIGVVVNDVASVNIDSKLVAQGGNAFQADGMVELQNGCACCSLSDELLTSISNLVTMSDLKQQAAADADDNDDNTYGGFHHIVIELSGVADPKAIRAKFQEAVMDQMPLMDRVQLDTMVSLVDCSTFQSHFQSTQLATREEMPQLFYPNGQAPEEEPEMEEWMKDLPPKLLEVVLNSMRGNENTEPEGVAELLTSQAETADLVILNKQDLVDRQEVDQLQEIIAALNPRATVMTTAFGQVDLDQVLGVAKGQGVAIAGAVDDHRDYVMAATTTTSNQVTMDQGETNTNSKEVDSHDHASVEACAEPDCTDPSHSHSHSHDHAAVEACAEPACTDPSHSHSHDHDHAAVEACAEPACTDPSHSHSHSHDHATTVAEVGADAGCTDPSHSHSHSHDHSTTVEAACADAACTDPSHSHSHSHDHATTVAEACADAECTDPSHSHSHSHHHAESGTYAGIGSFVYTARRPFHPGRLISFLKYLPVVRGIPSEVMMESTDYNDKSSSTIPVETQSVLKQCLRSKGFVWCANSHTDALYWSHAGSSFELSCLGQWWATLPRTQWPQGVADYVLRDFDFENHDDATNPMGVGDRRQEVVFIGPGLGAGSSQRVVTESLNQCLLTDQEYDDYQRLSSNGNKLVARFPNPLEAKYVTY